MLEAGGYNNLWHLSTWAGALFHQLLTLDRIFKRANKFWEIFGKFAYPSLTLNFLLHRNLWLVIGRIFWIGWSASNKNVNNYTSIPRVPPCAIYYPMMWLVNGLSWTVFGEGVVESTWVRRYGLVEGLFSSFLFLTPFKFLFFLLTWAVFATPLFSIPFPINFPPLPSLQVQLFSKMLYQIGAVPARLVEEG